MDFSHIVLVVPLPPSLSTMWSFKLVVWWKEEVHCHYKALDEERENALFYSYQKINAENVGRNTLAPLSIVWRSLYQFL